MTEEKQTRAELIILLRQGAVDYGRIRAEELFAERPVSKAKWDAIGPAVEASIEVVAKQMGIGDEEEAIVAACQAAAGAFAVRWGDLRQAEMASKGIGGRTLN